MNGNFFACFFFFLKVFYMKLHESSARKKLFQARIHADRGMVPFTSLNKIR